MSNVSSIVKQCLLKLDKYNVEGGKFHKNKGEKDITTPLGIYRGANDIELFDYIEEWFKTKKGLSSIKKTSDFTQDDINFLNTEYNKKGDFYDKVMEDSTTFYNKYLGKIDISSFASVLRYPFFNIFVNSKKVAIKAIQMSYCDKNNKNRDKKLCDGIYGPTTEKMIKEYNGDMNATNSLFYTSIFLKNVMICYVEMCTDNGRDDAQLPFLKGWTNRVDAIYKDLLQ